MKLFFFFFINFLFGLTFLTCQNPMEVDIDTHPKFSKADQAFANVYQPLDGTWKGRFIIYEDTDRKKAKKVDLGNISIENLEKKGLKQIGTIDVKQVYTSESPYFQKVTITDTYPESGKSVVSKGVNKIEGGKMLCVVIKPDEVVVHNGSVDEQDEHTIIWQRSEKNPQKVEYFRETVLETTYEIVGWGYYEGDDRKLSPRLWFHGKYVRQ